MNKFLILVVLFAAGCSAETVDSEKLDESYSGKIFKKYEVCLFPTFKHACNA